MKTPGERNTGGFRSYQHDLGSVASRPPNKINLVAPPPKCYRTFPWGDPMNYGEAFQAIRRYNRWADLWNKHEIDLDLTLSPDPACGGTFNDNIFPCRSTLQWTFDSKSPTCIIRIEGFRSLPTGNPFLRAPADPAKIVWAGWLEARA